MTNSMFEPGSRLTRRNAFKLTGFGAIGCVTAANGAGAGTSSENPGRAPDRAIAILVDFPDTDFDEVVMKHIDRFEGLDADLLMRRIAYLDRDNRIRKVFGNVHQHEQRAELLANSAVVITPCTRTVMAAAKAGATPIYIMHKFSSAGVEEDLAELDVSVVDVMDKHALADTLRRIRS
ncbi:hypothetical protein R3X27_23460 [Tropicimonas sp. TH_r6]|uniref:hypothetical protein n=1 Tax=Tropicimonas sp. TH_r6 TaxID=3082085 RepID=UPI00295395EC|nr:hypothetical protein [Tropicimonas sp. TH_r6]MDV7145652.1 hypothetical protein [Tropicimonas sp. TH_r6]